ncbi:hypothetical protein ACSFA3_04065 [Variovorax sp. RHLX14]|uniref:hypothetical protein n=1 Tax=Variovorax sp. RHLX14 TaxID=1259731 RepID=UPI003F44C7C9
MKSASNSSAFHGSIDASWFGADFRLTSPTWRLMHAEEAAASGEFACMEPEFVDLLAGGWPADATALVASAWWLAEALWRNGVAASVLGAAHLRRARQIGLAVLAITPVSPPARPALAAWLASELFDGPARATIRLQLARMQPSDTEACNQIKRQIAPAQAARLVGYARAAMGVS